MRRVVRLTDRDMRGVRLKQPIYSWETIGMVSRVGELLVGTLLLLAPVFSASEPKMTFRVVVPKEFRNSQFAPNGDPERIRYTKAYEAFWWNCVMVRAQELNARCPIICSGTPAAARGCGEGANSADDQIQRLLKRFPTSKVRGYLKSLASSPGAWEKLRGYGYFSDGPKAEDIPQ